MGREMKFIVKIISIASLVVAAKCKRFVLEILLRLWQPEDVVAAVAAAAAAVVAAVEEVE
jgi:hypothetical protein